MDHHPHDINTLMGYLGNFGKYQRRQFLLLLLSGLTAGISIFSIVMVAAVPKHRCLIPEVDLQDTISSNYTAPDLEKYIPILETGEFDSCTMFEYNPTKNVTILKHCDVWVYDTTYHKSSLAKDWNFVCHRKWMGAVVKSAYMLGVFIGAATLGTASDKYGRKIIFCVSGVLQLIAAISVAFISEYYTYLVITVLYGFFASAGCFTSGYVLTIELVGASKRMVCGAAFPLAASTGGILVAGWGALIADRQTLQVIYGLHSICVIGHWWLIDESPRWLWSSGRTLEAIKIIQKALKLNGSPIQLDPCNYVTEPNTMKRRSNIGIAVLFKSPNLRKRILNVCLCWFSNSMIYYFFAFSSTAFKGNPFLIFAIVNLADVTAYVIIILLAARMGRRMLVSFNTIVGGISCLIRVCLFNDSTWGIIVLILGKICIHCSFTILYNYTAELSPTIIRNSAIGIATMCARLSGILMPLLSLLDSFNPIIPSTVFGTITVISGFLIMLLPETLGCPMPETIEDAENFKPGDTCFTTCIKNNRHQIYLKSDKIENLPEQRRPLNTIAE